MEVRKCSKGLQAPFLSVSADEVGVLRVPEGKAGLWCTCGELGGAGARRVTTGVTL